MNKSDSKIAFYFLVLLMFICGSDQLFSQEKLEVQGAIIIDDSEDPSPAPGTIRWSGTDFEGWNGITWVSLTGNPVDSVTDADGNVYKTMRIGDQKWMIENLKVTQYNDNTPLPKVESSWQFLMSPAYAWYNNDSVQFAEDNGALYNWFVVADSNSRNICPIGWHVPTKTEWEYLLDHLDPNFNQSTGISLIAGGLLKATGFDYWQSPNTDADNSTGFSARGAGYRGFSSSSDMNRTGIWWSGIEQSPTSNFAFQASVRYNESSARVNISLKVLGLSVRCVR